VKVTSLQIKESTLEYCVSSWNCKVLPACFFGNEGRRWHTRKNEKALYFVSSY